jgi:hypothetical protein
MHFQFEVAPPTPRQRVEAPNTEPPPMERLLAQILDVQVDQLVCMRQQMANQDAMARWRNLLNRWHEEFPGMSESCREVLPHIERGYLRLVDDLTQQFRNEDMDGIDNDFALNEFLDRYGMRLAQLGTILNLVGTLADAGITESTS